uniref:Uncharacterized protein n=1 Tax=Nelumbo nucifera TaxID=4432 RepID=A0A822Z173_NELNU|nr:TPA_asm: hypothetical protein HUJ06_013064 [Nelumbo nucifera]
MEVVSSKETLREKEVEKKNQQTASKASSNKALMVVL